MSSKLLKQSRANKTTPNRRLAVVLLFTAVAVISTEVVTRISKPALSKRASIASSNLRAERSVETFPADKNGRGNPHLYEAFGKLPLQFAKLTKAALIGALSSSRTGRATGCFSPATKRCCNCGMRISDCGIGNK